MFQSVLQTIRQIKIVESILSLKQTASKIFARYKQKFGISKLDWKWLKYSITSLSTQ